MNIHEFKEIFDKMYKAISEHYNAESEIKFLLQIKKRWKGLKGCRYLDISDGEDGYIFYSLAPYQDDSGAINFRPAGINIVLKKEE